MSLKSFRDRCLEKFLAFLWREWTALGLAGREQASVSHVIDPEALLLFTCSLGRYDQRLFDEVLDWLTLNGRFLSVQRIKNILRQEPFSGGAVVTALADWLSHQTNPLKWKLLAQKASPPHEVESLFFLPDGRPVPDITGKDSVFEVHGFNRNPVVLRGYSRPFSPDALPARILRMRALFGVTARCDALAYLTMNRTGHPSEIAREMYYSQKAIHEVMYDLSASGAVDSVKNGRERVFRITAPWRPLFIGDEESSGWVNWPVLLATADQVWETLEDCNRGKTDPLFEMAEITLAVRPLLERMAQTSWAPALPTLEHCQGMDLLENFLRIFQTLAK